MKKILLVLLSSISIIAYGQNSSNDLAMNSTKVIFVKESLITTEMLIQSDTGSFIDKRDGRMYKKITIGDKVWMAENMSFKTQSGCWAYENSTTNAKKYGYLYDWEAAKSACPPGWHLPSKSDFEALVDYLGESSGSAYSSLIPSGKSGFNAIFAGWRSSEGSFGNLEKAAGYWSSSKSDKGDVWGMGINSASFNARMGKVQKNLGFSVRCVQKK